MVETITLREFLASLPYGNDDAVIGDDLLRVVLASVAKSGSYGDLQGLPALGAMAAKDGVAIADIVAGGSPSVDTYLRGDGTWSAGGAVGGRVDTIVAGDGIQVDASDPVNPIVSATSTGGQIDTIVAGPGIAVDATDPENPEVALTAGAQASLALADSAVQPGELGSAAYQNTGAFASAAQGAAADSALQPGDVGSAAFQSTAAFATAAQGGLADSALQPADIGTSVQAYDAATAKTDVAQSFSKPQRVGIVNLTDGATITPDLAAGNAFMVTLGGNRTIANPSNMAGAIGQEVMFIFRGAYQPGFGAYFKFPKGTVPTFSGSLNVVGGLVISSTEILCFGGAGMA